MGPCIEVTGETGIQWRVARWNTRLRIVSIWIACLASRKPREESISRRKGDRLYGKPPADQVR